MTIAPVCLPLHGARPDGQVATTASSCGSMRRTEYLAERGSRVSLPVGGVDIDRSGSCQRLDDRRRVAARDVHGHEEAAALDLLLERVGSRLRHARAGEHRGQTAGRVAHGLAEIRRQRPGRNDRADARHHERDGGEHLTAELTQPRRRARVLDVGSRRGVHLFGERSRLVVIPGNDRDLIPRNTQGVERASARGSRGRS